MFRVTLAPGSNSNIVKALRDKRDITVIREMARVADVAVEEAQTLARQRLVTDRPANRRSRPGSRRYVNSFKARVIGTRLPVQVQLSSDSQVAALLENGRGPSRVSGDLRIPAVSLGKKASGAAGHGYVFTKHTNAYGSTSYVKTPKATSPGNDGYHVMRDALRSAFRKRGARSRAT